MPQIKVNLLGSQDLLSSFVCFVRQARESIKSLSLKFLLRYRRAAEEEGKKRQLTDWEIN